MLLYQPSTNEIKASAAVAKSRKPHLGSRLDKAAVILADVNLNFDCAGDTWHIRSQANATEWYEVTAQGCTCSDYQQHAPAAKKSSSHYFCKHLLAYYGYRRMLGNAVNRRLIGNHKFLSERRLAQLTPGSLLALTDAKRLQVLAYLEGHRFPRRICFTRIDATERLVPQTDDDYADVSEWLAAAPHFETKQEEPRMEDYMPQDEWQPELNHHELQHWMTTGNTPAMQFSF